MTRGSTEPSRRDVLVSEGPGLRVLSTRHASLGHRARILALVPMVIVTAFSPILSVAPAASERLARSAPTLPHEVTIASGKLAHHLLTNDLFHIDDVWMRVPPGTESHRWLSQGIHREVTIVLTNDAARFGDVKNIRILMGTLIHETAPGATPIIHIVFLRDPLTESNGPITFETTDPMTATKFESCDGAEVSIVIQVK